MNHVYINCNVVWLVESDRIIEFFRVVVLRGIDFEVLIWLVSSIFADAYFRFNLISKLR